MAEISGKDQHKGHQMSQVSTKERLGARFEVRGYWVHPAIDPSEPPSKRIEGGNFSITATALTPQSAIHWAVQTLGVDIVVTGVRQVRA